MDKYNDYIITNKYILTEGKLSKIIEEIYNATGIECSCYETKDGYIFTDDKYGFQIGTVKFNMYLGAYNGLELDNDSIDRYIKRNEEERRQKRDAAVKRQKRKFKLQVGKAIAASLSITIAGTAFLIGLGVIDSPFKKHEPTIGTEVSVESPAINQYRTANDVLIIEWLNYAMGEVDEISRNTEYEALQSMCQEIYQGYFAPAMSAYYTYLDYKDSDLPLSPELGDTDLVARAHASFRVAADEFTDHLSNSTYFNKISFATTPLANAIVTDQNGNILDSSSKIKGELVDSDGQYISAVDDEAVIKIRIADIQNSPYSLENLPEDAQIINNEIYVSSKHMYQEYGSKSK